MPNTSLTDQQIASYRADGYLVIENFLTPAELATWRERVDAAVAKRTGKTPGQLAGNKLFDSDPDGFVEGRPNAADLEDNSQGSPSYYASVFTQTLQLWMDDAPMAELMVSPAIGKMAAELAGVRGIRIWHDQALIKEPWANPTGWHLDNPYWSFDDSHGPHGGTLSLWVALDDATPENGCMHFVRGSHRHTEYRRNAGIGRNLGELFERYPEWQGRAEMEPVAVPMRAGAASFHSGMTAHGAGANMTAGRRRAMTCGYMPDGATFNGNPNVLPPDYVATLAIGDVLDNDALNPLLWRGAGGEGPRL
jgi:ectoine hydroxylase-related dioxygenase (phytanoyl-CoA dioxygenase family)